ncbi:MAG: rRNA methyltransferase [Oceanospirillaceae bacterium]|jgi:16S rRNA (guanine1516-N2)-methyltransferase|nr:rRNA methyltransferase [Oceanospirillaceae bacterium]MBN57133.1 rRNA methyltransferase [Oceanospirillaceae bacterium]MDQ4423105.1 class I SAM-dependent methyltransferase [Thalassolituus sp.]|tara:strand:+ start:1121 stop:1909 length:789 start_codon:yes stop_codon:yes gene_type:complete
MTHIYCASELVPHLRTFADSFGLTIASAKLPEDLEYHLHHDGHALGLVRADVPKARVFVDFCAGATAHRRKFGGGKGQDIAKAVGVSSAYIPTVVDATAGLGRDSFVLATLGCQVTAIERQPVVAALLQDGLERARTDGEVSDIVGRIDLIHASAHQWLAAQASASVDIVYLDPMFEHDPKKKAAVKKDMQAFREVVGQDVDSDDLLGPALHAARCRVVVKRARKAQPLAGRRPSYSITGKSNRFDVYALARVEAPARAVLL